MHLAEPWYNEALQLYRADSRTAPLDLANAVRGLALLKFHTRQDEDAMRLWQEARDLYQATNIDAGVEESSRRLGLLAQRRAAAPGP
jgi:hypothetical protein